MTISTFDLFTVGIGPSSSHTVGPMRAVALFLVALEKQKSFDAAEPTKIARVKAEIFGSLGLTGKGHGTPKAILMGLEGETPENKAISACRMTNIKKPHEAAWPLTYLKFLSTLSNVN